MKKADISEKESSIEFRLLPISKGYNDIVNKVYYVVENKESSAMGNFQKLTKDQQDLTKNLIIRMATHEKYNSNYITYHLKGYSYGEISPKPHRFFFFIISNNIIFFDYVEKKKNSFNDSFYKKLNKKKDKYENAFEEHLKRNRLFF